MEDRACLTVESESVKRLLEITADLTARDWRIDKENNGIRIGHKQDINGKKVPIVTVNFVRNLIGFGHKTLILKKNDERYV